ncbi:MAG: magnesium/cobalt transporter CorA [Leadbetterella sp.]|nr:magnesium/cobalt transporter CorA [Leadbetterella sp.]
MSKNKKHLRKAYTSPGSLIYVGKESREKVEVKSIRFNESVIEEQTLQKPFPMPAAGSSFVHWVNVSGLHDVKLMENLGKAFQFHPLLMEDVLNTYSKARMEHFGDRHIFVMLKMLRWNAQARETDAEHVALVLGENYVVSFQEAGRSDVFSPVEERLKTSVGKTRRGKSDYLFYTLCDVIVDSYYLLLEDFSEKLEETELRVIENPGAVEQKTLYALRRELLTIRKAVSPLREIFSTLTRDDSPLIHESTDIYFRDIYDHVLQVLEIIDSYREMIENIQNIYLNNLSHKMNAVMKTLTVFTAIFMPLTFIVGIYGMNFENMPELRQPNGYFYTLGGMALLGLGLWIYFKWKKYM